MAIARTNLHSSRVVTTANVAISATTASFTPVANSTLVAVVGALNGPAHSIASVLASVSGGSLTWTRRAQNGQVSNSGYNYTCSLEVWTASVSPNGPFDAYDFVAKGAKRADIAADLFNLCDRFTATGAHVILCTLLPTTELDMDQQFERGTVNTLIAVEGAEHANQVFAVHTVAGLSDANGSSYADGLHLSDTGNTQFANAIAPLITGLAGLY